MMMADERNETDSPHAAMKEPEVKVFVLS